MLGNGWREQVLNEPEYSKSHFSILTLLASEQSNGSLVGRSGTTVRSGQLQDDDSSVNVIEHPAFRLRAS